MKKRCCFEKVSYEEFKKAIASYQIDTSKTYEKLVYPSRKTRFSAGYDIVSPIDFILEPNQSIILPTGFKVCMPDNNFLAIYIRSSIGIKHDIMLKNQVGIIDADYYNNVDNEGHIHIALVNRGTKTWIVKANEGIAQGIFQIYNTIDDEESIISVRAGGIGSTNKEKM